MVLSFSFVLVIAFDTSTTNEIGAVHYWSCSLGTYLSTSTLKIRWFFQGIVRWFSFPLWLQGLCGWRVATVTSRFTRKPSSSPPPSCFQRCMILRKAFLLLLTWRILVSSPPYRRVAVASGQQCWGSGSAYFWGFWIRIHLSEVRIPTDPAPIVRGTYGSGSLPFLVKVLSGLK